MIRQNPEIDGNGYTKIEFQRETGLYHGVYPARQVESSNEGLSARWLSVDLLVKKFQVPKDTHVTLSIYDVPGQQVVTLVDGQESAGYHQVTFNGTDFASGLYFYRISTPEYSTVMKMFML